MDLFSLVARLKLDKSDYEQGAEDAVNSGKSLGERLKGGLATAAKVGGAAIAAAATGVTALTKASVEQYAEYEQLVGGVETLFKASAGVVQQYASNAFKTAGLSANEYMATVTSFSASLLQSLGGDTAAAADLADQAITDMSDNANKMGTDMAAIQNAYNGFAKQNFTMLDNLKLGYGGTKEEMQRLLDDATKLSGIEYDISSYADIVQAIHVVQTELGITGTTAKEASATISGSIGMLKSAWANLVTGLGDENANFDKLVGDVVDSASTAAENLIPRVQQVLSGIAMLVERLAPIIAEKFPALVQEVLPPLLSATSSLLEAVVKALPTLVSVVIDALPGIVEMLVTTLADMAPALVDLALQLMVALANGLSAAIPTLIEKAPEIIAAIVMALLQNLPKIIEAGVRLMVALATGIVNGLGHIVEAIVQLGVKLFDGIGDIIRSAWQWGADLINNFTEGLKAMLSKPIDAVKSLASKIKSFLGFSEPEEGPLSNFHTYAPDMMQLFAKGITDNRNLITDAIGGAFNLQGQLAANAPGQPFTVPAYGGAPTTLRVNLIVDGRELAHTEFPYLQSEEQRVGLSLVPR